MNGITHSSRLFSTTIGMDHINACTDINHSDKTERLNCYEIVWIKSGECLLELNLKTYSLEKGMVCCFAPGQVRRLKFAGNTDAIRFNLLPDFFYRLCVEVRFPMITLDTGHLSRPMLLRIPDEAEAEMAAITQNFQREMESDDPDAMDLRSVWLKLFLMYLKRQVDASALASTPNRDMDLVNRFLGLVSKNFIEKKMVSDYASTLNVSANYLNLIVKRVTGLSARHHIQQYVILEAKREALASVKSMKEIAYGLGFADIAHFSKYFKSKSGVNFTSFKREGRHWNL